MHAVQKPHLTVNALAPVWVTPCADATRTPLPGAMDGPPASSSAAAMSRMRDMAERACLARYTKAKTRNLKTQ